MHKYEYGQACTCFAITQCLSAIFILKSRLLCINAKRLPLICLDASWRYVKLNIYSCLSQFSNKICDRHDKIYSDSMKSYKINCLKSAILNTILNFFDLSKNVLSFIVRYE